MSGWNRLGQRGRFIGRAVRLPAERDCRPGIGHPHWPSGAGSTASCDFLILFWWETVSAVRWRWTETSLRPTQSH